ncbi:MAG: hypothetical protein QM715_01200 [Nibricoccus sp.]
MKTTIVVIALIIGSWLGFDGGRALLKGDYVTARDGKLGPWSRIVAGAGINPRGAGMKWAHVALGALWLGAMACFFLGVSFGRSALIGCSILTLWYLPIGTVLSIAEIGLLCLYSWRGLK